MAKYSTQCLKENHKNDGSACRASLSMTWAGRKTRPDEGVITPSAPYLTPIDLCCALVFLQWV